MTTVHYGSQAYLVYTLLTCAAVFVDLSSVLDTHEMLLTRCLQARVLCPIQGS